MLIPRLDADLYRPPGVSCGIPDFRSQNGIYASLKEKGEYDLDDPQQMYVHNAMIINNCLLLYALLRFDIQYFKENPAGEDTSIFECAPLLISIDRLDHNSILVGHCSPLMIVC